MTAPSPRVVAEISQQIEKAKRTAEAILLSLPRAEAVRVLQKARRTIEALPSGDIRTAAEGEFDELISTLAEAIAAQGDPELTAAIRKCVLRREPDR